MVWFKVDDGLAFHRKAVAAGNAAMGLWVRAGSWCSHQLTDGFVPEDMIGSLGNTGQAKRLVAVRLWERVEGGYQFWQWNDPGRQPTREQVEQEREAARERMHRVRTGKRSSPERSPEHAANGDRSSDAVRLPRPDPSRPEGTGVTVGESSTGSRRATDDDSKIDERIIELLAEHAGRTVSPEWAARVRRQILTGRDPRDPAAYVAAAIRGNPRDYLPTGDDHPSSRSVREAIAASMGDPP
ncbi:hypothetical protein [Actinomadura alba]|uniref:Uncharacterized protein n=1 Tax=Actinomadura alba TaxID=406431 RepID=A0ABR7LI56_9ACTN|nr:hypothetical protein [Actinomadura alba]MBC6464279.1 hypothetical protein [Actinomadura alba]